MTAIRMAVVVLVGVNIAIGSAGYGASPLSLRYGLSIIPGGLLALLYATLATSGGSWSAGWSEPVLPTISIMTWLMVLLAYRPKQWSRRQVGVCVGMVVAWYALGFAALYMFAIRAFGT